MRIRRYNRILALALALVMFAGLFGCAKVEELFVTAPRDALVINEVVASNQLSLQDPVYGSPDWIELLNTSQTSLNLSAYYITDNPNVPQKAFRLPDVTLAPGAFYLLYAHKKTGENSLGFSLKKSGETLTLLDAHMEEICSLIVPALIRDVSYARRPDGTYGFSDLPTPGAANTSAILDTMPLSSQLKMEQEQTEEAPPVPALLITEIVAKNKRSLSVPGCEGCTEWVELYNTGDKAVSLSGLTLTDDLSEGQKHNLPEQEVAPGQFLVVCCGRMTCTVTEHVRIDVGLSAQGEELFLFDSQGAILDHVSFPALIEDVSWARRSDGAWGYCLSPTPGAAGVDGEIRSALDSETLQPSPMDDPFHTVYINEVLYRNGRSIMDADGDRSDFAELYNGGNEAVDLAGWYLSDSLDKLTKWALPEISLAPGEYLLIFLSGKDRSEGELHTSFSLHAGETLVLYNSAALRYDAIRIQETEKNVSIGRSPSGEIVYYSHPTPLEANGNPMTTGK